MTDDERAAWMTPPPELVRGCDSPEGVRILADWLDEHGGDGAEFREQQRDAAEQAGEGWGDAVLGGYASAYPEGDGHGSSDWFDRGDGDGCGCGPGTPGGDGCGEGGEGAGCGDDWYGTPYGDGSGFGAGPEHGFGNPEGDGGPDVTG